MREPDYFSCPYCDYVSAAAGACPDCESPMQKITGEESFSDDLDTDHPIAADPMTFDDDPDAINWNDGKEGLSETI